MIINKPIKTTGESIDYLNKAVFGEDPDYTVLSRVYESSIPIQDRVNDLETNRVNEATVEALQAKVDSLEALTTMFANLAYPVPNLVSNGDLLIDSNADNIPDGFEHRYYSNLSLVNGVLKWTSTQMDSRIRPINYSLFNTSDTFYKYARVKANSNLVSFGGNVPYILHSGSNNFEFLSSVFTLNSGDLSNPSFLGVYDKRNSNFTPIEVDYIGAYNVSTMKLKGVKDDNGTPFTLLTNTQIKTQLDLWMATQFPLEVLLQMNS